MDYILIKIYIFWWCPGFEPQTCIYYALSLPTELSSQGLIKIYMSICLFFGNVLVYSYF